MLGSLLLQDVRIHFKYCHDSAFNLNPWQPLLSATLLADGRVSLLANHQSQSKRSSRHLGMACHQRNTGMLQQLPGRVGKGQLSGANLRTLDEDLGYGVSFQ